MADAFLLDTNVVSELMRSRPEARVLAWFDAHPHATFHISTVTRAEIELGIALLPAGSRRSDLSAAAVRMFEEDFAGRCLFFDAATASDYAQLVAHRKRAGCPITTEDAQIAATARVHRLVLVTRNTRDFGEIPDVTIIDPWGFVAD